MVVGDTERLFPVPTVFVPSDQVTALGLLAAIPVNTIFGLVLDVPPEPPGVLTPVSEHITAGGGIIPSVVGVRNVTCGIIPHFGRRSTTVIVTPTKLDHQIRRTVPVDWRAERNNLKASRGYREVP